MLESELGRPQLRSSAKKVTFAAAHKPTKSKRSSSSSSELSESHAEPQASSTPKKSRKSLGENDGRMLSTRSVLKLKPRGKAVTSNKSAGIAKSSPVVEDLQSDKSKMVASGHTDCDGYQLKFAENCSEDDRQFFMEKYPLVDEVASERSHCTACDKHIGTAPISEEIIRTHQVLGVTQCDTCFDFYVNSGDFTKGEGGWDLYCRWCGDGGDVFCCATCSRSFCKVCIIFNLSEDYVKQIEENEESEWSCFVCNKDILKMHRAQHWALRNFMMKQLEKIQRITNPSERKVNSLMKEDKSKCCSRRNRRRKQKSFIKSVPAEVPAEFPAEVSAPIKRPLSTSDVVSNQPPPKKPKLSVVAKPKQQPRSSPGSRNIEIACVPDIPCSLNGNEDSAIPNVMPPMILRLPPLATINNRRTTMRPAPSTVAVAPETSQRLRELLLKGSGNLLMERMQQRRNEAAAASAKKPAEFPTVFTQQNGTILVERVELNTPFGRAKTEFEDEIIKAMDICQNTINKMITMSKATNFKTARSFSDLNELYTNLQYVVTYASDKIQELQGSLTTGKQSLAESLAKHDKSLHGNHEVEIVEQENAVIELMSDDEKDVAQEETAHVAAPAKESTLKHVQKECQNLSLAAIAAVSLESTPEQGVSAESPTLTFFSDEIIYGDIISDNIANDEKLNQRLQVKVGRLEESTNPIIKQFATKARKRLGTSTTGSTRGDTSDIFIGAEVDIEEGGNDVKEPADMPVEQNWETTQEAANPAKARTVVEAMTREDTPVAFPSRTNTLDLLDKILEVLSNNNEGKETPPAALVKADKTDDPAEGKSVDAERKEELCCRPKKADKVPGVEAVPSSETRKKTEANLFGLIIDLIDTVKGVVTDLHINQ